MQQIFCFASEYKLQHFNLGSLYNFYSSSFQIKNCDIPAATCSLTLLFFFFSSVNHPKNIFFLSLNNVAFKRKGQGEGKCYLKPFSSVTYCSWTLDYAGMACILASEYLLQIFPSLKFLLIRP